MTQALIPAIDRALDLAERWVANEERKEDRLAVRHAKEQLDGAKKQAVKAIPVRKPAVATQQEPTEYTSAQLGTIELPPETPPPASEAAARLAIIERREAKRADLAELDSAA